VTIADERHRAPTEVPEEGTQGFTPLNPKNHLEQGQLEAVAIDDEGLSADGDVQGTAAARAIEAVTIGHDSLQARCGLPGVQHVAPRPCQMKLSRPLVQQGPKMNTQGPKMDAVDRHQ
jgi:hypothetical protein